MLFMNKKLLFLTKTSLLKKIKSKWFLVVNILILIIIIGIINIDSIISFFGGDFNDNLEIVVIDNTNSIYDIFKSSIDSSKNVLGSNTSIVIEKSNKKEKELEKNIDDKILIVFTSSADEYLEAKVISKNKIDAINYQLITSSLSSTKYNYGLINSNIDIEELKKISSDIKIDRVVLDKDKKSTDDNMETIMGTVFPTVILPFFMLVIFFVQMIGSEIYEEKSSRGMEIIISNVSAKTHFLSKIFSSNLFVIIQGILLMSYGAIGLLIKNKIGLSSSSAITSVVSNLWDTLVSSGFVSNLYYIIPLTLILLLLSFLSYSLVSGILASMTVNMEDYQQIQTPVMLVSILAYYLAIMAGVFDGSVFIKVLSYVPFISCLLSPALLVLGQISIIDVIISIVILIVFNIFVFKRGIRIYKEGILNYSNEKVWSKFKKIIRNKG